MNNVLKKIFYLIIPITLGLSNYSFAYDMPVGIPDSSINFEQAQPPRPSNWSEEVPGYYYIDLEKGSYAPNFGSETSPRKTIPTPIPAGSYVEIAGEYSLAVGGVIHIKAEGDNNEWEASKAGPVWVTSAPNTESAFTERKVVLSGKNAFVTNMTFKDHSFLQVGSLANGYSSENIVVRDNTIIGYLELTNGSILSVLGNNEESSSKNIILFKNIIRDAGNINSTTDLDVGLIQVGGYASDVWILENLGYNASGSGVQLNARPPRTATKNIYVGNNEFYNVRQSGLAVKFATNVIFSSNYLHDIVSTAWSPSKGIGAQYEPEGLWIINNHIHNVEYGVLIASTYDVGETELKVYTVGNIIHDVKTTADVGTSNSWQSTGIHIVGGHEHHVYNNLIFNAPNGIINSSYNNKTFIKNNIIFDLNSSHETGSVGFNIWSVGNKGTDKLLIDNNFFDSELKVKLNNTIYETPALLSENGYLNNLVGSITISDTGIESITSTLLSTPELSNKLKDNGTNINNILLTEFKEAFPDSQGMDLDFLSSDRVLGRSIDIGPLEQEGAKQEMIMPTQPSHIQLNILN